MKHLSISLIILISCAISAESNDINTSGFEEKKTYITCSRGSARGYMLTGPKEAAKMKKVLMILNHRPSNSEETLWAYITFLPRDISFVDGEKEINPDLVFLVKENVKGFVYGRDISFTKNENFYSYDVDWNWDEITLDRKTLHFKYKKWIKDVGLHLHYETNFKKKCEVIDYNEYKRLALDQLDKNMSKGIKEYKKRMKKNKENKEKKNII